LQTVILGGYLKKIKNTESFKRATVFLMFFVVKNKQKYQHNVLIISNLYSILKEINV